MAEQLATGFLGYGTINNACAVGLLTATTPLDKVIVSPRSAVKANALRDRFPDKVTIAQDNQELLDKCRLVFIAVLPGQAKEVLSALNFRPDHRVVSLMAGVSNELLNSIMPAVQPENIVRAVPLPPVKDHAGVTVIYPADPEVVGLFNLLGVSVAVNDAGSMNKLPVLTCMMGSYYAYLQTCHQWLVENGVDSKAASKYVGAQMHSIATDGKHAGEGGFEELIAEQTPGGYNEMGIRELREAGVWDEYKATLSSIAARWEGKATASECRPVTERGAKLASITAEPAAATAGEGESLLSTKGLALLRSDPEAFDKMIAELKK